MPTIAYIETTFQPATLVMMARANAIIQEYALQGFDLTLRQLYYQLVSRGVIPNYDREYKRLGKVVNQARLLDPETPGDQNASPEAADDDG
jgi:hypothetical protein